MFTLPTSFSPLQTRMSGLLYRKATWCINSHATATIGMYAVSLESCRTELNNTFPNLSALSLHLRNACFLPVDANLPPRLIPSPLLLILPLDFIFYKIQSVLNIMMTVNSLFLPKAASLFIYLLFFPFLYFHQNFQPRPLPTKKNSCIAQRFCTNDAFSLVFF